MFVGEFQHAIDEKSRIVLPSKFRAQLSSTVYLTLDLDHCISLFSEEEFNKKAEHINSLDDYDPSARALKLIMLSNTFDSQIDKQGRVTLPKSLCIKAKINKNITLIGAINHVKIFADEVLEEKLSKDEDNYESLAASFASRG